VVVPELARGQKLPRLKKRGRKEKAKSAYQLNRVEEMQVSNDEALDDNDVEMQVDQAVNVGQLVANAARGGGRLLANAARNIRPVVEVPVVARPLRGRGSRGPNRPRAGGARRARI
jgi:hypothetical protein